MVRPFAVQERKNQSIEYIRSLKEREVAAPFDDLQHGIGQSLFREVAVLWGQYSIFSAPNDENRLFDILEIVYDGLQQLLVRTSYRYHHAHHPQEEGLESAGGEKTVIQIYEVLCNESLVTDSEPEKELDTFPSGTGA
jgi:hypothetical protein